MTYKIQLTESLGLHKIKEFCTIENLIQVLNLLSIKSQEKVDKSTIEIIRGVLLVQKQSGLVPSTNAVDEVL